MRKALILLLIPIWYISYKLVTCLLTYIQGSLGDSYIALVFVFINAAVIYLNFLYIKYIYNYGKKKS